MTALNRSAAELVINALYLQFAEEVEVERFIAFDLASAAGVIDHLSRQLTSEQRQGMASERQEMNFDQTVHEVQTKVGIGEHERAWSKRSVLYRASATDRHLQNVKLMPIFATSYQLGHSAVHSTWFTLTQSAQWEDGDSDLGGSPRVAEVLNQLRLTVNMIATLGKFLAERVEQLKA